MTKMDMGRDFPAPVRKGENVKVLIEKQNPLIWTIDGYSFSVKVPPIGYCLRLRKKNECTSRLFWYKLFAILAAQEGHYVLLKADHISFFDRVDTTLMTARKFDPPEGSRNTFGIDMTTHVDKLHCSAVLTPLNNKGYEDIAQFSKDNPDGVSIKGGTLYVDGEPQPVYPTPVVPAGSKVWVGDTRIGCELTWHAFEGRMICTDTMFVLESPYDIAGIFGNFLGV